MTTAELAYLLLPDQPANRFVSHELIQPIFLSGPLAAVRFFARPVPLGNDFCSRDVVYADLEPVTTLNSHTHRQDVPVKFERTLRNYQLAAAPQCRMKSRDFFAWVQPESAFVGAPQALRRLLALQQAARRQGSLPVEVSCATETSVNACDRPPSAVLASLPVRQIFIIEPRGDSWEFSVMSNGPGRDYWHVMLPAERGADQRVKLVWRVPAPF